MKIPFSNKSLIKWALIVSLPTILIVLFQSVADLKQGYHWLPVLIVFFLLLYAYVLQGDFLDAYLKRQNYFVEIGEDYLRFVEPDKNYEAFIRLCDVNSYQVRGEGSESIIEAKLLNGQKVEVKGYSNMKAIVHLFINYPGFK